MHPSRGPREVLTRLRSVNRRSRVWPLCVLFSSRAATAAKLETPLLTVELGAVRFFPVGNLLPTRLSKIRMHDDGEFLSTEIHFLTLNFIYVSWTKRNFVKRMILWNVTGKWGKSVDSQTRRGVMRTVYGINEFLQWIFNWHAFRYIVQNLVYVF